MFLVVENAFNYCASCNPIIVFPGLLYFASSVAFCVVIIVIAEYKKEEFREQHVLHS